jgi:hypothetical protein
MLQLEMHRTPRGQARKNHLIQEHWFSKRWPLPVEQKRERRSGQSAWRDIWPINKEFRLEDYAPVAKCTDRINVTLLL